MSGDVQQKDVDVGTAIMDILVFLLEDQRGKKYEYHCINSEDDKTA